jgi:hypothetical protein
VDASRFDALTRVLHGSQPRRLVLGLLISGALGLGGSTAIPARKKKKKKGKNASVAVCLNGQTLNVGKPALSGLLGDGATMGACPPAPPVSPPPSPPALPPSPPPPAFCAGKNTCVDPVEPVCGAPECSCFIRASDDQPLCGRLMEFAGECDACSADLICARGGGESCDTVVCVGPCLYPFQ